MNYLSWKLAGEIKFHTVIQSQIQYLVLHMLKSLLAFREKVMFWILSNIHFFEYIPNILGSAGITLRILKQLKGNKEHMSYSVLTDYL